MIWREIFLFPMGCMIVDDQVVHDTYLRDLNMNFDSEKPLSCIATLDLMTTLVTIFLWKLVTFVELS